MDINQIQLPASLVADLYHHSLVEPDSDPTRSTSDIPVPAPAISTVAEKSLKSLGDNQKNILVVVDYADAVFLPDEELTFLTGILGACKLSMADVAVFNRNNYPSIGHRDALNEWKSKIVFLFGIQPPSFGLPVDFPPFQVQNLQQVTWLYSPSLDECRKDPLLKSKLWVCLRRIFGI